MTSQRQNQAAGAFPARPNARRAARAPLNWSQAEIAEASGVGESTIIRFESGSRKPHANTLKTLRATLEAAGIVFLEDNGAIGAILRPRDPEGN